MDETDGRSSNLYRTFQHCAAFLCISAPLRLSTFKRFLNESEQTAMGLLLLGAHMSIAGGVSQALDRAASVHSNAVQVFTKNNRQWAGPPINAGRCRPLA
jgi:hypothetical protein